MNRNELKWIEIKLNVACFFFSKSQQWIFIRFDIFCMKVKLSLKDDLNSIGVSDVIDRSIGGPSKIGQTHIFFWKSKQKARIAQSYFLLLSLRFFMNTQTFELFKKLCFFFGICFFRKVRHTNIHSKSFLKFDSAHFGTFTFFSKNKFSKNDFLLWPIVNKRQIFQELFFRNQCFTLILAWPTNAGDLQFFWKSIWISIICCENWYLITKKKFIALKKSKILRKMFKITKTKKFWGTIETEWSIFVKNGSPCLTYVPCSSQTLFYQKCL